MLRTLAINSNQIVLSFGVLIAFLSPKQSEIEESSLESVSKSRAQGVWDPANSTQVRIPSSCRALFTRMYHIQNPAAATFPIRLPRTFHPDVLHLKFISRLGKEGVSTSLDVA